MGEGWAADEAKIPVLTAGEEFLRSKRVVDPPPPVRSAKVATGFFGTALAVLAVPVGEVEGGGEFEFGAGFGVPLLFGAGAGAAGVVGEGEISDGERGSTMSMSSRDEESGSGVEES